VEREREREREREKEREAEAACFAVRGGAASKLAGVKVSGAWCNVEGAGVWV